jgi:uncharacterized protein involved in cysteine biosynthesis
MVNIKRLAVAGGIVWGLVVFLTTIVSLANGYGADWLRVLESVYPGFHATPVGSVIGLVYGFVGGFLGLGALGFIYNKLEYHIK